MSWHEVIDERNHAMDLVVARVLEEDPARLDEVVAWIQSRLDDPGYSIHSKDGLSDWLDVIQRGGLPTVLETLRDISVASLRLRQSSPFAVIMPQEERLRILSRYEALRTRARPASI